MRKNYDIDDCMFGLSYYQWARVLAIYTTPKTIKEAFRLSGRIRFKYGYDSFRETPIIGAEPPTDWKGVEKIIHLYCEAMSKRI